MSSSDSGVSYQQQLRIVCHVYASPRSFPSCTQTRLCHPAPGRWWWSERRKCWQRRKGRPQSRPHRRWTFLSGSLDWDPGLQRWHPQSASRHCKEGRAQHNNRWDTVIHPVFTVILQDDNTFSVIQQKSYSRAWSKLLWLKNSVTQHMKNMTQEKLIYLEADFDN